MTGLALTGRKGPLFYIPSPLPPQLSQPFAFIIMPGTGYPKPEDFLFCFVLLDCSYWLALFCNSPPALDMEH